MDLLYPQNGYIMVLYCIFMKKIEVDNVIVMLTKTVDSEGRVSGLKNWQGKEVIVLVLEK